MIKHDPRLVFIALALHHITIAREGLELKELEGLKLIVDAVITDGREDHAQER